MDEIKNPQQVINVHGGQNQFGNGNNQYNTINNGGGINYRELVDLLQTLQSAVRNLPLPEDTMEEIEADIKVAIINAKSEKPDENKIKSRLQAVGENLSAFKMVIEPIKVIWDIIAGWFGFGSSRV